MRKHRTSAAIGNERLESYQERPNSIRIEETELSQTLRCRLCHTRKETTGEIIQHARDFHVGKWGAPAALGWYVEVITSLAP